jgi:hypothetical protein
MRGIQYAAAPRFHHQRLWNTGSPAFAGDDTEGGAPPCDSIIRDTHPHPRGALRPSCPCILRPKRAWGMPGARCTRSRACSVESTRVSHHGRTGITRHSRTRMVLTVSFALSPVTGLVCHRRFAEDSTKLDASVGASGPHDFAVRGLHRSSLGATASTASPPALMTLRNAPLSGQDGASCRNDLPDGLSEIFFARGLDR